MPFKYARSAAITGLLIIVSSLTSLLSGQERFERSADSLLRLMTIEEKIGQMTNIGLTAVCEGPFWNDTDSLELDSAKLKLMLVDYHIGSIQNKGKYPPSVEEWNRIIKIIQDYTMSNSRLGIPVLMGIDGVHGANYTASSTLFPHQIACAATWDPQYARLMGEITAYELRASSIPWNYAPVLDISFQPLWGRLFETFGEDTYLTEKMGLAFIEGSQGNNLSDRYRAAVCLKHFIGYGNPDNGKDRSPATITDSELWQYYIPPFKAAIDAGALTVMLNSGSVNGIPGHVNQELITNILKNELGFKGFVISDWDDISKLVSTHFVARDNKEAARMAVLAGMDMCMVPYDESFARDLLELVNEGSVPLSRIDDAVRRILYVKFSLGLFSHPYTDSSDYPLFGSESFADASYRAAADGITLLKNKNSVLPLSKSARVLVTGPAANSLNSLNGAWSRTWSGVETDYNDITKPTIYEAIRNKLGESKTGYSQGSDYDKDINSAETAEMASAYDAVIVCLGEMPATEKPGDIDALDLPWEQINLVREIQKAGKPVILVLVEGRPRIISKIEPLVDAVVMAYIPGHEGGRAITDILFGDSNPSGRLPFTYPRYSGSIWKYNHKGSDEIDAEFGMTAFNPQFQFGEGMSYTSFCYSDFVLSTDTLSGADSFTVSVRVTNCGNQTGKEVTQVYIRDMIASVTPDVLKLVRFRKTELEPGASEVLTFTLSADDMAFVNNNNNRVTEEGEFKILVGGSPNELASKTIHYLKANIP